MLTLDIGLDVCVLSEAGEILAKGPISDIQVTWRSARIFIGERSFLFDMEWGESGRLEKTKDMYIVPSSLMAELSVSHVEPYLRTTSLRFKYMEKSLSVDTKGKILQHVHAIAQLIESSTLTAEERRSIESLIKFHGRKEVSLEDIEVQAKKDAIDQLKFKVNMSEDKK